MIREPGEHEQWAWCHSASPGELEISQRRRAPRLCLDSRWRISCAGVGSSCLGHQRVSRGSHVGCYA
ncbi:hypothetical protein Q5P01_010308 [Channa striata]|uniref:Uncharacterized protein n=1 Tax=Channa striata TaxID=64152 RepID=A0AA88MXJ8_CHASR|nr:hypothetical protein Q5P01_010308 [Channa striata]